MLDKMKDLVETDNDMDLIEALEKRFSLHDVDMIYNVLYEFLDIDTKQGEITFLDFLNKREKKEKDRKFSLTNKKNAKKFTIKRKNYDEAKQWLINHLDLSEEWTIEEIK